MATTPGERPQWRDVLAEHAPLLLPAAHDGLTAKLIERAGFPALQIGGFAVEGARHGFPDIDLTHYAEMRAAVRDVLESTALPVLVDGDDGYGDVKNVTRVVRGYEAMGVGALFLEDQKAPKRCGHMTGKKVIPVEAMEAKIRAAVAARNGPDFFLIARTDARAPHGLADALRRAERYHKAGADGLYVEAPKSVRELKRIGKALAGIPLAVTMLEGGGQTPWTPPAELHEMGFSMILYPTTLLFRLARAVERGLADLKAGRPLPPADAVDMDEFEQIVGMPDWSAIEQKYQPQ
ncbi:MAG TPA: isocitrate lyase/PEP mutase family protein [Gemmataceae bacterium]